MCEKNRKEYEYKPSEFLKCKLKEFDYVSRMEAE
jgi:hypothetical protein